MALFLRGDVWWYEFYFAGRRIRESTKSPLKTLAKTAEQIRKRELEQGFNNITDTRQERIRTISDLADEYLVAYKLRHPLECPATFVPVEMRQTGMRGTGYGTREEAYGGADRESAATG